jgi:parvulin-like peptidyl-prolyl isomerase
VAVLAVAVAACSAASDMATVDGVGITQDDVLAMRSESGDVASSPAAPIRQDLTTLILEQSIASAAEEQFGVTVTADQVDARLADPPPRYVSLFEQIATDATAGERLRWLNARFTLVRDAVIPELLLEARGSYEAVIEETPEQVMQACVKHILVGSEEEAEEVIERLEAGEDFAAVAAEVSLDQQSQGGVLGSEGDCVVHHSQMGEEFVAGVIGAPLGEVTGPVQTSFGYHVIQVDERVFPTAEQLAADPMAYLDPEVGTGLMGTWFTEAVADADIDVRSSVGVWSPDTSSVVAAS